MDANKKEDNAPHKNTEATPQAKVDSNSTQSTGKSLTDHVTMGIKLPSQVTQKVDAAVAKMDANQKESITGAFKNLGSKDNRKSIEQFTKLSSEMPKEGVLQWFQGAAELKEGNEKASQDCCNKAQKIDSTLPDYASMKATATI